MRISVVMTTYNGEKYCSEQIESILRQRRCADEIIIVDDCSTDGTLSILENYSSHNRLIHVFENAANQGWKKNFRDAIKKSSGDIVILCDQDDIWYENKLECIENVFLEYSWVQLLASEYDELVNGKVKKKPMSKPLLTSVTADTKLIHTYYPGCTYAFKKSLYEMIEPIWNDELPHDAQLGIAAKLLDSMAIYRKPLIIYRRHENNATKRTIPSREKKENYIFTERKYVEFAYRLVNATRNQIESVDNKIATIRLTNEYINKRKCLLTRVTFKTILDASQYIKYYYSPRTFVGDIFFGLKGKD